jgi:hypothetical protein
MDSSRFSFASSNHTNLRKRGNTCWCDIESPLMTSWTYENPGRRFYGCGGFKVMRKKGCNHFEWFDEEMSFRAKEVIRSLKNRNDELMEAMSENKKFEETVKKKNKYLRFVLGLTIVFLLLVISALVLAHVLK